MPHQANSADAARQPTKACGKCGETKSLSEFYPHRGQKSGKHGVQSYCKICACRDSIARAKLASSEQIEQRKAWKREWLKTPKGRASLATNARRYKAKNPTKAKVRQFTALAIELGVLARPDSCSSCGAASKRYANGRVSIEAHHPDHSRPLDVIWLCMPCHRKADKVIAGDPEASS